MKAQASVLTTAGRGAIATIRVWGPAALAAVERWFSPARGGKLSAIGVDRIVFGHWRDDASPVGEELVVCRTATDSIEIHCHGGDAAVERILATLAASGCEITPWQEWREHTSTDRIATASLVALADARTERAAAILLDQYRGALRGALLAAIQQLTHGELNAGRQRLQQLLSMAPVGLRLTQPLRVVLAGAPNVGKSSLINALAGYERAIVFDQPGTTRDVVTVQTALDGWLVELCDTAGIRAAANKLEAAGIARTTRYVNLADLVLWVRDATAPHAATDEVGQWLDDRKPLVVWNKCDLPHDDALHGVQVSALTGLGLKELERAIVARLCPRSPTSGEAVPFTLEQVAAIEQALKMLDTDEVSEAQGLLMSLL